MENKKSELDNLYSFLSKKGVEIKFLLLIFAVIGISIYVGILIYGDRGLNHLISLQENQQTLQKEVDRLKKENVQLQKEYFGLKEIEGK